MAVRAIAIHQSQADDRLNKLFADRKGETLPGVSALACARCGTPFSVYLVDKSDPDNADYIRVLETRVEGSCDSGVHAVMEIDVDVTPLG